MDERTASLSKELYDILIAPLDRLLDPKKEVFFVTDKPFHQLPLGALIERLTGKYLVEKFVVSYSPSTAVFLHCTNVAKQRASVSVERCLSVGESVFRQRILQNSSLPSTAKEAEQVATHYGANAQLMLDSSATEPAVRMGMKSVEVVHIATHGLINERRPQYSSLVFWEGSEVAPSDSDGMLYAWEISNQTLPHTRLVVLSACQTLLGRDYKGEGMMGVARAFLAAGAPLVIASLWKVDSQVTAKFMDGFHARRTKPGMTTARALCEMQREMLKKGSSTDRRPAAWAGFISLGGYAQY
jgi:CHAT domain-containing protein